jgi:hypothetical protein
VSEAAVPADHSAKTIVNIGEVQWHLARTHGMYLIPGCPKGERCATVRIQGRIDRADIGDKRYSEFYFSAKHIAEDLVADIADHGVFVAAGDEPTDEEISAARERLTEFYRRQVAAADADWSRHHNHNLLSDVQRRAARYLGVDREWLFEPEKLVDCPACGERIKPGVAVCRGCGAVLDAEKARQFGLDTGQPATPAGEAKRRQVDRK